VLSAEKRKEYRVFKIKEKQEDKVGVSFVCWKRTKNGERIIENTIYRYNKNRTYGGITEFIGRIISGYYRSKRTVVLCVVLRSREETVAGE